MKENLRYSVAMTNNFVFIGIIQINYIFNIENSYIY